MNPHHQARGAAWLGAVLLSQIDPYDEAIERIEAVVPGSGYRRIYPIHQVILQDTNAYDELEPEQRHGFDEYFVVRTPATALRYRSHIAPGTKLIDATALGRIFAEWTVDVGRAPSRGRPGSRRADAIPSLVTPTQWTYPSAIRTAPWQ